MNMGLIVPGTLQEGLERWRAKRSRRDDQDQIKQKQKIRDRWNGIVGLELEQFGSASGLGNGSDQR